MFPTLEAGQAGTVREIKNKDFPGRKGSFRSIAARFGDVLAHLISIDMILLATFNERCG